MASLILPAEMGITASQDIILSPSAHFKPCSTLRLALDSKQPAAPQSKCPELREHIPHTRCCSSPQQVPPPAAAQHSSADTATLPAGTAASGNHGVIEYLQLEQTHSPKNHSVPERIVQTLASMGL